MLCDSQTAMYLCVHKVGEKKARNKKGNLSHLLSVRIMNLLLSLDAIDGVRGGRRRGVAAGAAAASAG